jgi:hypothetical protein
VKSKMIKLYKLKFGQFFVFASDPDGPVYKLERGNGMYHWITRVNERGMYSAHIGSEVIPVDPPEGE